MKISRIIKDLVDLKKENPEQEITIETPQGTVTLKLGDALIYEGMDGSIVIDSE